MGEMTVSVVVPTRNRIDSLERTLAALVHQTRAPDEIIIVDASDAADEQNESALRAPGIPVRRIRMHAGVCAQRNRGIREARGTWVLLCDDDVEVPSDYLARLLAYVQEAPKCGAVTGLITEPDASGSFGPGIPVVSLRHVVFAFVFQTTVFGDTSRIPANPLMQPLANLLSRWFERRGNTWSAAGWPLFTQVQGWPLRTATYGLGATLVRRDWLKASPFDERLGTHGIGDNYGVAMGFPEPGDIVVLSDLPVRHHKEEANRLSEVEATYRRILALDLFLREHPRFSLLNRVFLVWSVLGQTLVLTVKRRPAAQATRRALRVLVTGANPLRASIRASIAAPLSGRQS